MVSLDQVAQRSAMVCWNTSWKALLAILPLIACVAANSISFAAGVLAVMSGVTLFFGKTPWRVYCRLFAVPLVFLLTGTAAILVEFVSQPTGLFFLRAPWFCLCITEESMQAAALAFGKSVGAVSCLYMLALSTPSHRFIAVMARWRVPKILTELMTLIYRFLFILLEVQEEMAASAAARLGGNGFSATARTFTGMASTLFLTAMARASAAYDAMEARCYDGELAFLEPAETTSLSQMAITLVCFIFLGLLLILVKRKGWV